MTGEFMFISILFSLILCSVFVKMYYQGSQEGFTPNPSGATGSTGPRYNANDLGSTGPALPPPVSDKTQPVDYNHFNNSQTNGDATSSLLTKLSDVQPSNANSIVGVDMDNYILKSSFVPPMCPACPSLTCPNASAFGDSDKDKKDKTDKKSSDETTAPKPVECGTSASGSAYNGKDTWPKVPCPILPDFTTYGI